MQKVEYEQHPLSAAFPRMTDGELFQLIADVGRNGQREPIVIYDGKVLDGWHRYLACQANGRVPESYELGEEIDPVSWVLSRNLHRRHLSASQRAAAEVACNEWRTNGRPWRNPAPGAELIRPATTKKMAEDADVSPRTINHAKVAHSAGLGDKVRDGELSAKKAAEIAKPKEPALCIECRKVECICPKEEPPPSEEAEKPEEMVTITKERLDELETSLASALISNDEMGKIIESDDHLKAAVEDRDTWKRKYEAMEKRFISQTNEFNECKKTVKRLQGTIKKLQAQIPKREREPGEDDE